MIPIAAARIPNASNTYPNSDSACGLTWADARRAIVSDEGLRKERKGNRTYNKQDNGNQEEYASGRLTHGDAPFCHGGQTSGSSAVSDLTTRRARDEVTHPVHLACRHLATRNAAALVRWPAPLRLSQALAQSTDRLGRRVCCLW